MFLIVGLGNPEKDYANTRHNMGFNVINKIAEKYEIDVNKEKFNALFGTGEIEGKKVILVKPQTYMNLSGEAVVQFINYYKIPFEDLLVIYDDVDINPGKIRIRKYGSAGTHNGMRSVVKMLKTEKFPRVRIGIGMPDKEIDIMLHVIGPIINDDEKKMLNNGIELGKNAVIDIIIKNIDFAMNKYN